ncbi:MAG: DUF6079 family protein, partial [Halanaerobium sp.]
MATYRDMFELSRKPEDVITMDEAVKNRQDEIINNYVITSEIEGKFNNVLHQLSLETGKGYWVQGAYGCGKSHFMSFLTVLLSRPEAWERMLAEIRQEYRETFINNNYLTVNFTLSETSNLRMKLFDELETVLHREGIDILIKKDEKIVDQFLEYEYQMMQKELFYQRLEDYCEVKKEEWEKYLEENDVEKLA